jgi:hypothetical protein
LDSKQFIANKKLKALLSTTKTAEVKKIASNIAKALCSSNYLLVLDVSKSVFETSISGILNQIGSL